MNPGDRLSTGSDFLDRKLGGGFLPGTLVVVRGTTGVGKTILGLQFAHAGLTEEGRRGIVVNFFTRGDTQNHPSYARDFFGWPLLPFHPDGNDSLSRLWEGKNGLGDYFEALEFRGRRVNRSQMEEREWREWNAEYQKRRSRLLHFLYGNFVSGARRLVLDGIEPDHPMDPSFQMEVAEEIAHNLVRKEPEWLAREFLRERYFANREAVARRPYDHTRICTLLLQTSSETMLEKLEESPTPPGDLAINANTLILLGKIRQGGKLRRALRIVKHRASPADESVHPFEVNETGLHFTD